jgi:mannose-1-phosphate guanylyltransferase / mannose-6-phosphate isomerase
MINVASRSPLWPLSRAGISKQFLSLNSSESLFQQAAQLMVKLGADGIQVAKPLIVTVEEHWFLAAEQLREADLEGMVRQHRQERPLQGSQNFLAADDA